MIWALEAGFTAPGLAVISEQDVLGDRLVAKPRKKRKADNFLREVDTLSAGDLVVHVEHGVGRYLGLETITALGAPHACVALEYAENAKLYLPVENIELLSRYGHEEGLLDRLGGGAWQAKKAKLKQRIREIADRLMRIAAERALRHAPILEAPHSIWEAFAARFPYQETDDQLSAIADVVADLEKGSPDGPADRRRRGFWQDRSGDARGLCRGDVGDAGGGDRADDAAGAPALPQFCRTLSRLSDLGAAPVAFCLDQGCQCDPRGTDRRHGGYRCRHPCAAGQGDPVQEPRACW